MNSSPILLGLCQNPLQESTMACTIITMPQEHNPPVKDEFRFWSSNILLITKVTGINILFLFLKKLIKSTWVSPLCMPSALNDRSTLSINCLFLVLMPFKSKLLRLKSTLSTGTTADSMRVVLTTYLLISKLDLISLRPLVFKFLLLYQ